MLYRKSFIALSEINEAYSSAESAVEYAIRCWRLITDSKATLDHGNYKECVGANCEFSSRIARAICKRLTKQIMATRCHFQFLAKLGYDKAENHLANGTGEKE